MSHGPRTARVSRRRFLTTFGTAAAAVAVLQACAPAAPPPAAPAKPTEAADSSQARKAEAAKPVEAPKPVEAAKPVPTQQAPAKAAEGTTGETSDFGVPYPADAGPKDKQVTIQVATPTGQGWKAMDFNESVYARGPEPVRDNFTEPLIRLDKNWQVIPGLANKWEISSDGRAWTFFLDKGVMWTTGDEVTADDFIATFRYTADPKHAWDFTWYWSGVIRNYADAVKGSRPVNDIGVKQGADKYQVVFETEVPVPYLPQMMIFSWVLHAKSLEQHGSAIYNTNPATCVSCGPYFLEEWSPDRRIAVKSNPKYTGKLKPLINRRVVNVVSGGSDFQRYQAGEIDYTDRLTPADLKIILGDPGLKAQLKANPRDFRTFYTFFDITKKPFDDKRVRLAFAKAIDREAIIKGILAPLALPAYSFLMPGFPDANSEGLKPIQNFNPEEAKKLIAEAGYPNGQGFPKQTLLVRGGGPPTDPAVTQAVVASIKQTLNVEVDLQTQDQPAFMADLNAKPTRITWGWLSYGMDYFDATNLLGVWKGGGRHNWNNDAYDQLLKEGGQIADNPQKRTEMLQQAERLLVEDAPGVYVYHQLLGQLHKPYRKGAHLDANKYGYDGWQWPGEYPSTDQLNFLYMGKDVVTMRKV